MRKLIPLVLLLCFVKAIGQQTCQRTVAVALRDKAFLESIPSQGPLSPFVANHVHPFYSIIVALYGSLPWPYEQNSETDKRLIREFKRWNRKTFRQKLTREERGSIFDGLRKTVLLEVQRKSKGDEAAIKRFIWRTEKMSQLFVSVNPELATL